MRSRHNIAAYSVSALCTQVVLGRELNRLNKFKRLKILLILHYYDAFFALLNVYCVVKQKGAKQACDL